MRDEVTCSAIPSAESGHCKPVIDGMGGVCDRESIIHYREALSEVTPLSRI